MKETLEKSKEKVKEWQAEVGLTVVACYIYH